MSSKMKLRDPKELMANENELRAKGFKNIAGVDEVGRGPLAGPVVCVAIIMDLDNLVEGVDDSKKLSEKKREMLFDKILEHCRAVSISAEGPESIDKLNILNATKKCMADTINNIELAPDIVLIDAVELGDRVRVKTRSIIHGDAVSYSIACASIIAKVTRDRLMQTESAKYPEYEFAKNKGYGTASHIEAIKKYGLTAIHRRSFVKNFVGEGDGRA